MRKISLTKLIQKNFGYSLGKSKDFVDVFLEGGKIEFEVTKEFDIRAFVRDAEDTGVVLQIQE